MVKLAFMIEVSYTNLEQRVVQALSTDIYPLQEVSAFHSALGMVVAKEGQQKGGYLRNGVSANTYCLIIDSAGFGLHQRLPDLTREAMRDYFGSSASTYDLKAINGFNEETNRKRLHNGLEFLHQELSQALGEQGIDREKFLEAYPPTLALRLKNIHNTIAFAKRRDPLTHQGREHDPDTKRAIAIGKILHQNQNIDPDLRMWRYATKNHLFSTLRNLTKEERVELRHYYERGQGSPSRSLLDRFGTEVGTANDIRLIEKFAPGSSLELKIFYLSQTLATLEEVATESRLPIAGVRSTINQVLDNPDLNKQWNLVSELIDLGNGRSPLE